MNDDSSSSGGGGGGGAAAAAAAADNADDYYYIQPAVITEEECQFGQCELLIQWIPSLKTSLQIKPKCPFKRGDPVLTGDLFTKKCAWRGFRKKKTVLKAG